MMNIEKLPKSRLKAVFTVTAEEFENALDKSFQICNKKVSIKGFRKGAAPRPVYEKNYGVESLYDEALNVVLNEKIKEVYNDEKLANEICGQFEPNIETTEKLERGKEFAISLSFDVYPEVTLGKYKGLEIKKANLEASIDEVNLSVNSYLKQKGTLELKDEQIIALGDTAKFDFAGSVDGTPFDGGTAEGYELEIGSNQFIPGFEEQMIGMKQGEEKVVKVTFPAEYQMPDLAGKLADFKVKIHEIKTMKTPELNDDFVVSLNIENVKTVSELEIYKKKELEASKEKSEKDRQVDEMFNMIIDSTNVDMPDSLVDVRVNQIRSQYEEQAKMYNVPFDTFLGLMNMTKEKFESDTYTQGKRQALFNVVISKLIEQEKLTPTKEEIEAKAEEEALTGKSTKEQLMKDKLQAYYSDIAYTKVVEFLLSNAKLV